MEIDRSWLRIMGLAGVLGGLALFAGDMLFYYSSAGTDLKLNMGNASDTRIVASGVAGLVGTWLYVVGAGQVFQAFKTTTALARNTVTACFVAIFIAYGIVHGAYIAIATTARLSVGYQIDVETATALAVQANNTLRLTHLPDLRAPFLRLHHPCVEQEDAVPEVDDPLLPAHPVPVPGTHQQVSVGERLDRDRGRLLQPDPRRLLRCLNDRVVESRVRIDGLSR